MRVTITPIANGYLVTHDFEGSRSTMAFAELDGDDQNIYHVMEMLEHLVDVLGHRGHRYSPERIHIGVKPGDKYEEAPEEA